MSSYLGAVNSVNSLIVKVFRQPKGDLADRLSSRITVILLSLCSALLLSTHLWGETITCWTPAQFTDVWKKFVNEYCFVHGTYFVPLDAPLEYDNDERRKIPINYYQWVPFILAAQAMLFYLPKFLWKSLCTLSGYDLANAIRYVDEIWEGIKGQDAAFKTRVGAFEARAAVYIWDGLRLGRRKNSRELSLYYTASTMIQALNAWLQWFLLNRVLQSPMYSFWGPSILGDLMSGVDWQETGHFPRITHCDFSRRRPASVQLDTVLCVLTLNIYYEKIFIFLWFWLLFVALVCTANFVWWLLSLCVATRTRQMVYSFLRTAEHAPPESVNTERFLKLLGSDGLFVLHQLALNIGDIPTSYLTIAMRNIAHRWDEGADSEELIPLTAKH